VSQRPLFEDVAPKPLPPLPIQDERAACAECGAARDDDGCCDCDPEIG
jgi:hypothetical protein